jgi:hypothetical protein
VEKNFRKMPLLQKKGFLLVESSASLINEGDAAASLPTCENWNASRVERT